MNLKAFADILELAMAYLMEIMLQQNPPDRAEIVEKTFDHLLDLGFEEQEIQMVLERLFPVDDLLDAGFVPGGISNAVFSEYSPSQRTPVELLSQDFAPEDDALEMQDLQEMFSRMYRGKVRPDLFEIFLEGGDISDPNQDTLN
ncbi:MAG TPA: hypothetical protein PLF96_06285 [Thermotogota bacterium]|nr:hypothetical protein [Thermotogota bacterium]